MTLPASLVGRTYPTHVYPVSRAKVVEFVVALGGPAPVESAEPLVAPPTFAMIPVMRGFESLVADLGIELARVVHTDQSFEHSRAIRSDDVLHTTASIDSHRDLRGSDLLGLSCAIHDDIGELVTRAHSGLLIRPVEHSMENDE